MATATHYSAKGETIGEVDLPARVFESAIHKHAIWEVVRAHLANRRQGTAKVKTRAEVAGGGAKPWRQKGTGRARRGTLSSPISRGGGRAFGPRPRSYNLAVPKKVKSLALRSALSARAQENKIGVIDAIEQTEPKTREIATLLGKIGIDGRCLLVLSEHRPTTYLSTRNIQKLNTITIRELNTYAVMQSDTVLFESDGLAKIEEMLRV